MQTPLTLRRWQRAEYDRLVDLGVFQGEPIELIGGQLVVAEPQGSYHASAITKVDYALRAIVPPGWIVRLRRRCPSTTNRSPSLIWSWCQDTPGTIGHRIRRTRRLWSRWRNRASTFDRTRKGSLYARAAVPDYWLVNLVDGVVEVYRDPEPDASAAFGWRYRSVTRLAPPATVAPLGFSGERIAVADLLP